MAKATGANTQKNRRVASSTPMIPNSAHATTGSTPTQSSTNISGSRSAQNPPLKSGMPTLSDECSTRKNEMAGATHIIKRETSLKST
eukprot:scaffold131908_cov51-Phaeocystis_antarctica.AAC.1